MENRVAALPRVTAALPAETGIWVAVAAISMSFAALISALIVRQGIAPDWLHFELPRILYLNTLILLISSFTLEISRNSFGKGKDIGRQTSPDTQGQARALPWLCVTITLGAIFVAGQFVAWHDLTERGFSWLRAPVVLSFMY